MVLKSISITDNYKDQVIKNKFKDVREFHLWEIIINLCLVNKPLAIKSIVISKLHSINLGLPKLPTNTYPINYKKNLHIVTAKSVYMKNSKEQKGKIWKRNNKLNLHNPHSK